MDTDITVNPHAARNVRRDVRVALLVLSAIGVLSVVAGMEAVYVSEWTLDYQRALERSSEQRAQIRGVSSLVREAETSQRGYLLTGDPNYLRRFEEIGAALPGPLAILRQKMEQSPDQLVRARALDDLANARLRQLAADLPASDLAEHSPAEPLGATIHPGDGERAIRTRARIQKLVETMIAFEERTIADASQALAQRIRFSRSITIALLAAIALLVTFVVSLGLAYLADSSRIEAELHEAMASAHQANEAKTQFLASMSHEIRTPLTGILGYTELLQEEPLAAHQHEYVEHLQIAGLGLAALVDDILEFSKIEAGEISLVEEPLALATLLDNVLSIVALGAAKKGLTLEGEVDPALPETVLGDEARLRQVLLNLLTNAIKFTRQGSVTVRLVHEGDTDAGASVLFEVADTGMGIAVDKRNRLFRRFSQVNPSIQHEYGGTGLGLAISKKHVELMGGTIGFDSEPGRGSTFWFRMALPRSEAPAKSRATEGDAMPVLPARILLVEDSPQNRDLVHAILKTQSHQVDLAKDGEEAVAAARAKGYDLILMDIQMPRMDGLTASRCLRESGGLSGRTPIIAMTANALGCEVRAFRSAGIDDHITKPFTRAQMIAKVAQWLPSEGRGRGLTTTDSAEELDELRGLMGEAWVEASLFRLRQRLERALPEDRSRTPHRDELKRAAHQIISDAGQLGLRELSDACGALERACIGEAEIEPSLSRARRAAARARITVDRLLAGNACG